MRVALIAPPFITVPPKDYGGTELFIAQLAEGLMKRGAEVVVYTNGESTVGAERRWLYEKQQWPIKMDIHSFLKEAAHTSWAVHDAAKSCDVIHVQSATALTYSRFSRTPVVCTLHGPHEAPLSALYAQYPEASYICISQFQCNQETMPNRRTIHHGIDLSQYRLQVEKQRYLSFVGRIAPIKGVHLAIEVARQVGIPLRIAGDIQPAYRDYFEQKIKPELDGNFIEYVGLADLEAKNELLGNSIAMLFPIQWNEPFGLVMVEAMACGTPVLALRGGSVPEIVKDGVSGYVCRSAKDMARKIEQLKFNPADVRSYVEENFSIEKMVRNYEAAYSDAIERGSRQHAA